VGWNDAIASSISTEEVATAIPVNKAAANKHDDMDDEIPF